MLNGSYDLHILFFREPQIGATRYPGVSKKKVNQYAMGMPFMPDAKNDNGLIEVATYRCSNRFTMF